MKEYIKIIHNIIRRTYNPEDYNQHMITHPIYREQLFPLKFAYTSVLRKGAGLE